MAKRTSIEVFYIFSIFISSVSFVIAGNVKTDVPSPTTIKTPEVLKNVCDVCNCIDDKVDCRNRNLTTNLEDHEWPKTIIKLVTFENNAITHVKQFPNATIQKLKLCNNKIENIDGEAFKWLNNLTELDLSHNLLTYENLMPYAFQGRFQSNVYEPLDKLRILNLSGNKLHSMNQNLFEHLKDLKILILSDNPFSIFDHSSTIAISEIPYLEELDLSHCDLKKLDEASLHSLRFLKKLNVSYNQFSKLPDALDDTKSIETLILDGNPIEILDKSNVFPALLKLKDLSLNNMSRLLTIDKGALSNLENLENLSIANCSLLEEIDGEALAQRQKQGSTTWPPLKKLNLANNALRYLPSSLVARWDKLEELHLMNNQWSCDCDNQYLIGTLLPENGKRLMGNETLTLKCSAPPEHLNKPLETLSHRTLRCLDAYGGRPERDAAVLVGMLLGILLAIPVVLIIFIFWRKGFLFCGAQGPASFSRAFYRRAPPYDYDI